MSIKSKDQARAVIVHGAFGTPNENWFPWLARELESKGYHVDVPALPTPDGQSLASWTEAFHRQVSRVSSDTVLVGHSIGATFILRLLESLEQPVRASFLVSAFASRLGLPEFDSINSSFVDAPFDWARIRTKSGPTTVYIGENDPYVSLSRATDVAKQLGAKLTIIHNGGHLNLAAGFEKFWELLNDINSSQRP
jgi:uncharacterized protein